jgi:putative ABC transport system permease protein
MAARYWPGTSAVGKRFRLDPKSPWVTVAGVVADVKIPARRLALDDLKLYARFSTSYGVGLIVVRMRGEEAEILGAIRRTVDATSSRIRLRRLETVDERMAEMLAGPRFTMTLFVAFAGLALLLATIGLYGVISYSVGQRTREIGVRIALGADASAVVGLVVRQGLGLTMAGVIVGLAGAAVGSRAMESMLFEVDRLDPLTFGGVALLLLLVTLLASYLPARRAALVDPVVALRSE